MQSKLVEELNQLETLLDEMVVAIQLMHQKAVKALEDYDKQLAIAIIKQDEEVNRYDEEINENALQIMATQGPVAVDLRTIISTIRVATDVERIGDYAKTMAEFIVLGRPIYDPFKSIIMDMSKRFLEMNQLAYEAFKKGDASQAYEIASMDKQIDAMMKEAFSHISEAVKNQEELINALYTFNIIRILERAGDHTKNICEAVIFKVKGKKIDLG